MAFTPAPGEQYTVRQKILKIFGAAFHVFDAHGNVVAFCKQKAFRFREDIRLYTDETRSQKLLTMRARSIIDFGATYDVALPDGSIIASFRRKGMRSVLRDTWHVFGPVLDDHPPPHIATLSEDSTGAALARRLIPLVATFSPQKFHLITDDNRTIATFRTHFHPFVYRLGVAIHQDHPDLDELAILAGACLIAAIEGRQGSNDSGAGIFSGN